MQQRTEGTLSKQTLVFNFLDGTMRLNLTRLDAELILIQAKKESRVDSAIISGFSQQGENANTMMRILNDLTKLPLSRLAFESAVFTQHDEITFFSFLKNFLSLRHIEITRTCWTDDGLQTLIQHLPPSLSSLGLKFTHNALKPLLIEKDDNRKTFALSSLAIGGHYDELLKLKTQVFDPKIAAPQCLQLLDYFHPKRLDLSGYDYQVGEGLDILLHQLLRAKGSLISLNMSTWSYHDCLAFKGIGIPKLFHVLPQFENLNTLILSDNHLNETNIFALTHLLPQLKSLVYLDISANIITKHNIHKLISILPETQLCQLEIDERYQKKYSKKWSKIQAILEENKKSKHLAIAWTQVAVIIAAVRAVTSKHVLANSFVFLIPHILDLVIGSEIEVKEFRAKKIDFTKLYETGFFKKQVERFQPRKRKAEVLLDEVAVSSRARSCAG